MKMTAVNCFSLTKSFGETCALDRVNLTVQEGEILALVGPSGCGKTTLLRLIAGFERPDAGEVWLKERRVAGATAFIPPEQRRVGMIFQDYALFPHLSVKENIAFGLAQRSRRAREARVGEMLELVRLPGYGCRYPHELSGGERQRVALARALAPQPALVLLDEPFSSLDAERRVLVREEVRAILKDTGAAAVFVTHDQEEALYIGDRLAVLNRGRIEQVGAPEAVFHLPATRFVAEFLGQTDFLPGEAAPQGIWTEVGLVHQETSLPEGTHVQIGIRPDDVEFEVQPGSQARVVERYFKGAMNLYRLRLPSGQILHSLEPHTREIEVGTAVQVYLSPGHRLAYFPVHRDEPLPSISSTLAVN